MINEMLGEFGIFPPIPQIVRTHELNTVVIATGAAAVAAAAADIADTTADTVVAFHAS